MANSGEVLLAVSGQGHSAQCVPAITLAEAGLLERDHLQEWLIAHPQVLGSTVKIVAVEYAAWVADGDAQRTRLDILGLDADGHLVVAELKRGVAPDTVDMQAIKYAALASRFRLDTLAAAHAAYCSARGDSLSAQQATEALLAHAELLSDETLANPRVVIVAQDYSPIVISSVVWLVERGVDLTLVRFQPYRHDGGQVFVTFSQLYPLPDLEKSLVAPGAPVTEISDDRLPAIEWRETDLLQLGRIANLVTRVTLDLCSDRPDEWVNYGEVLAAASVTSPVARGHLAGLTIVAKRRFGRRNRPFETAWNVDGSQQVAYRMAAPIAASWRSAVARLEAEQADDDEVTPAVIDT